jgi:hypothetical protein
MSSVKPTIDAGGRMILVSRVDKTRPQSPFKRIYAGAKQKKTEWEAIFLPWFDRPDRDQTWYEAQQADILHRTDSLDDLHEQYPTTDAQALLPRTLNKRIAPEWINQCYEERSPLRDLPAGTPPIPGLEVYVPPKMGRFYVIGADPAEGNPTSDDSALTVLDRDTGEEVASLAGKLQPSTLAAHIDTIGKWYNNAVVLIERNNHGQLFYCGFEITPFFGGCQDTTGRKGGCRIPRAKHFCTLRRLTHSASARRFCIVSLRLPNLRASRARPYVPPKAKLTTARTPMLWLTSPRKYEHQNPTMALSFSGRPGRLNKSPKADGGTSSRILE